MERNSSMCNVLLKFVETFCTNDTQMPSYIIYCNYICKSKHVCPFKLQCDSNMLKKYSVILTFSVCTS